MYSDEKVLASRLVADSKFYQNTGNEY